MYVDDVLKVYQDCFMLLIIKKETLQNTWCYTDDEGFFVSSF